jgi:hypothetical protein
MACRGLDQANFGQFLYLLVVNRFLVILKINSVKELSTI